VLSRGVEEHAGFATQSARATTDVIGAYRIVLACELVAAVRALRLRAVTVRRTTACDIGDILRNNGLS
jgi:histidine ammonia-lyase